MRPTRSGRQIAIVALWLATLQGLTGARAVTAQLREPPGQPSSGGWAPVALGVRAGRDSALHYYLVGGQLHIPVLPNGAVELMPNMDVTFARGAKDYQYNLELVYVLGGSYGGLYGGGGIGYRKARFGPDPSAPRETARGYTAVIGLKLGGRVSPQVEWRWVFIGKEGINPQQVTLGVNVALWNPRR
jgi:hypothetical protein